MDASCTIQDSIQLRRLTIVNVSRILGTYQLREAFPEGAVFGRTEVMKVLGLKASGASELLMKLRKSGMVEAVSGQGKGKYRFILFS